MNWQKTAIKILLEGSDDLRELARIAGYDAHTFYIDANFRDADLSHQDLSGIALDNADLSGARLPKEKLWTPHYRPEAFSERLSISMPRKLYRMVKQRSFYPTSELVCILLDRFEHNYGSSIQEYILSGKTLEIEDEYETPEAIWHKTTLRLWPSSREFLEKTKRECGVTMGLVVRIAIYDALIDDPTLEKNYYGTPEKLSIVSDF